MTYPSSHWLDMGISKRCSLYLLWFYICVLLSGFQVSVVSCKDFTVMDEIEKVNKNTGASDKNNPSGNAKTEEANLGLRKTTHAITISVISFCQQAA